jgi:hypothetical protein
MFMFWAAATVADRGAAKKARQTLNLQTPQNSMVLFVG